MRLESYLAPIMRELFDADPSIGNNAAVARLQAFVKEQPDASYCDRAACHTGYLDVWRGFVRRQNAKSRGHLKLLALDTNHQGPYGDSPLGQLQLPLPDGQSKVTMGKARVVDLRRSAALLIAQVRGQYATIRQLTTAAELLENACDAANEPDLTLEEGIERGLIDMNRLAVA